MSNGGATPAPEAIPVGWVKATLGEICLPVATTRPDERPNEEFVYIDISSIDRASKAIASPQRLLGRDAPSRARQVVRAGDVLVSTVRPNLRAIARVPEELDGQIASTGFCVLRPADHVLTDFLFYVVREESLQRRIQMKARGVSYPAVRPDDILGESVLLPPEREQLRLVALLERQLARVSAGSRGLLEGDALVGRYRAACRAAAFAGALTGRAAPPLRPLHEVAEIQSGLAKGKPKGADAEETRYISTANVQAGYLDLSEIKTLLATPAQRERHRLRAGDVLVLEGGDADKVGRGWLWEGEIDGILHQNHVFAVRPHADALLSRYLAHYINAPQARAYFLSSAKQTTNLASINKRQLKELPVPLPASAEQAAAVTALEERLAALAELERALAAGRAFAAALERAVITKAIAGELVDQDRYDEPATGLLEKIAKQREDESQPHPGAKKRRTVLRAS
jgi:type I restriction enzyme S subunit